MRLWKSRIRPTDHCRSVLKFCYPGRRKWSVSRIRTLRQFPCHQIGWVREGHSQDMPAEGSIFDVSPDLPGFNMRPAGGGLQPPDITQPPPSTYVNFNDPFFGAPIAFAQCHKTPGLDTPMTLPIYNIPKDANIADSVRFGSFTRQYTMVDH